MNSQKIKKSMIILFVGIMLTPLSIWAQEDAITKYFEKYMDDEKFTIVYITPKMFQMISKLNLKDKDGQEIKEVLQDLRGLRILQAEHDGLKYYKEAINTFKTTEYELLMSVRDKDENVRFWTKESNGIISELLMLVGEKEEFTLISFIGNISLDKISKLASKIDIDGAEHLKKLKKND